MEPEIGKEDSSSTARTKEKWINHLALTIQ
jgi:hypothetical protein